MATLRQEEIQRSLGRIEGQLNGLTDMLKRHFEDDQRSFAAALARDERLEDSVANVARSLGNVKKKVWFSSGFAAAIGSGITLFATIMGAH